MKTDKISFSRILSFLTAVASSLCMIFVPLPGNAAKEITQTVNLSRPEKNVTGDGYYWNNRENKLILQGINLSTSDDYGIKLIDGATVELRGDNYISASLAAIAGQGSFTITGDGKLTVISERDGITSYSTEQGEDIRIRGGKIEIRAGECGIRCEGGTVGIVDAELNVAIANADEGYAVLAKHVAFSGGSVKASAPIAAQRTVRVSASELEVDAKGRAALSAIESIIFEKVDLAAGNEESSVTDISEYSCQSVIVTRSNAYRDGTSALLGEGFPRYADVLIVIAAIMVLLLIVLVPLLSHRRRTKALIRRLEAEKKTK